MISRYVLEVYDILMSDIFRKIMDIPKYEAYGTSLFVTFSISRDAFKICTNQRTIIETFAKISLLLLIKLSIEIPKYKNVFLTE